MPGPGNVGERVRNLRLTRRLSQAQLAGHDLSDSYISLIESGKRTPTPTVLRMLAERLGCTPEYLAEGVEPEQRAHLEVRERHACLALMGGDPATAEAGFDEVIARSDDQELTARARWGRARALEELGRTDHAIALFEDLREQAERDPGRASWLPPVIALARCYHSVGDLGQAVALGERTMERLRRLGLGVGQEHTEAGRILLLAYVDRSDPVRAHEIGRRLLYPDVSDDMPSTSSCYQRASIRALEEGTIGDSLYFADQALAARTDSTPVQVQARLYLAAAKALLRGVTPFSKPVPSPLSSSAEGAVPASGDSISTNTAKIARPSREVSPEAAREALDLLQGTSVLEGAEATESTIAKARALVLVGELDVAIATLEECLDTALAAPSGTGPVVPLPGDDLTARTQRAVLARVVLAQARIAQGDLSAAQAILRAASEQLSALPAGRPAAQMFRELGEMYELVQDTDSAACAYRLALEAAGLHTTRAQEANCDLGRV